MKGFQFCALTYWNPKMMNSTTTASFRMTMMLLARADSRMPTTRMVLASGDKLPMR